MINYQIQAINPSAHLFEVLLTIESPAKDGQVCYLPDWIPGSYMIRDFAKHIQWIEAESKGKEVVVKQLDKSSWQFGVCDGPLEIRYQVYAWDLSVRGSHLDQTHGFFNGTSVFLAVKGQEEFKNQVEIVKPKGSEFDSWKVATGLKLHRDTKEFDFGHYYADNYDQLIDCPVEMSDFELISFEANGIPHHMALTGRIENFDRDRLTKDLKIICEHHLDFFGDPVPINRYTFMTYVLGKGFGGLEHKNSTALHCSREDLPLLTDDPEKVKPSYQQFLDLCSHEYFHTWNIKRIKPAVFLPYDTSKESYTELLWVFEGFTSYYDSLALVQSKIITLENYLTALAKTLTSVKRAKGRLIQTITDSSFNAWTKYYKQDENASNAVISYYTKGTIIALCLDFIIRDLTSNQESLKSVMNILWTEYGAKDRGVENDTVQSIVYELCANEHRSKLERFFETALYSTDDLDLEKALTSAGLDLTYVARKNASDRGGYTDNKLDIKENPSFGMEYRSASLGITVKSVYLDSAASKAGISAGDNLITINGLQINHADFNKRLLERSIGDSIEVLGFRRDELHTFQVTLEPSACDTAYISYKEEKRNPLFKQWLKIN